jgi:hypothetical protein
MSMCGALGDGGITDLDLRRFRDACLRNLVDAFGHAGQLERACLGRTRGVTAANAVEQDSAIDGHRADVLGEILVLAGSRERFLRVEVWRLADDAVCERAEKLVLGSGNPHAAGR